MFLGKKFSDHGADERAKNNGGKSEKDTDEGADDRADYGLSRRTELFGAKHGRPEIDTVREHCEYSEDYNRPQPYVNKVFGPRRQQEPGKNQRCAGDCRENQSHQAGSDKGGGKDPKDNSGIHPGGSTKPSANGDYS